MLRRTLFKTLATVALGLAFPVRVAQARLRRLQRLEWPGQPELWWHLAEPQSLSPSEAAGFGAGAVVHRVTRVLGPAKAPRTDVVGWDSYQRAMLRARYAAPSKTGRTLP